MNKLSVSSLTKKYGFQLVFQNISFELHQGEILGITGSNGSGKSTLIKSVLGLLTSSGDVSYYCNEKKINKENILKHVGYVSPHLFFYENLTAIENITLRYSNQILQEKIKLLFAEFNLAGKEDVLVRNYSSGMIQRLRLVYALCGEPSFLFLDEPNANLDEKGTRILWVKILSFAPRCITLVASNESSDEKYFSKELCMEKFK